MAQAANVTSVRAPAKRARLTNSQRETVAAVLFLLPNLLAFLILTLGPVIFSFVVGFTNWTGLSAPRWVGVQNYLDLPQDAVFLTALRNTLVYTLEFTPLCIAAALGLALLFNRKAPGTVIVRLLCFLPIVTDFIS